MSKNLSVEAKIQAVGEALQGASTLTEIAQKYGLSIGYLSILTSRAKGVVAKSKRVTKKHSKKSENIFAVQDLINRVSNLEVKFNSIFK